MIQLKTIKNTLQCVNVPIASLKNISLVHVCYLNLVPKSQPKHFPNKDDDDTDDDDDDDDDDNLLDESLDAGSSSCCSFMFCGRLEMMRRVFVSL